MISIAILLFLAFLLGHAVTARSYHAGRTGTNPLEFKIPVFGGKANGAEPNHQENIQTNRRGM